MTQEITIRDIQPEAQFENKVAVVTIVWTDGVNSVDYEVKIKETGQVKAYCDHRPFAVFYQLSVTGYKKVS